MKVSVSFFWLYQLWKRPFNICFIALIPLVLSQPGSEPERSDEHGVGKKTKQDAIEVDSCNSDAIPLKDMVEGKKFQHNNLDGEEELDESFWEDGARPISNSPNNPQNNLFTGVTIEFDGTPDSGKRKTIHRASAEDKVNSLKTVEILH